MGNSTALGTTVREASEGLTSQSTPTDVRHAVEAIVSASRKMEERSTELEEHLQATKKSSMNCSRSGKSSQRSADGRAHRRQQPQGLRRSAFRELAEAEKGGQPLCLVIGDIDHFKKFNDTLGHRTGDQVLRLVASCLKTGVHAGHFVARYGGEEFAVIMLADRDRLRRNDRQQDP